MLYYSKEGMKQDKCFSVEMHMDKKGKTNVIGKRQTFMLEQFQNGQIFEKEIYLGNEDIMVSHGSFQDNSLSSLKHTSQARLFLKI